MSEFDNYIVCSTLNQMVNYLPFKSGKYEIKEKIYSIHYEEKEESRYNQKKWNKSLENVVGKAYFDDTGICLAKETLKSKNDIINRLDEFFKEERNEKLKNSKILWNITGGQRILGLAIAEFIEKIPERKNDEIIYFEGNSGMCYALKNEKNTHFISYEDIKLTNVFMLMGFEKCNVCGAEEYTNYLDLITGKDNKYKEEYEFYKDLNNKYINDDDFRQESRDNMVILNKNGLTPQDKKECEKKIMKEVEKLKYPSNYDFENDLKENKPFGKILEKMTLYKILEALSKNTELLNLVSEVTANSKIKDGNGNQKTGIIDEFDVLLLTKTGQVVVFECKSGSMDGNNAKSHNYSTYAIAGVYGVPNLITPMLIEDSGKIEEDETLEDHKKLEDYDSYENIKKAVNSARRANLEIWGLNNIENKLKKIFNEQINGCEQEATKNGK